MMMEMGLLMYMIFKQFLTEWIWNYRISKYVNWYQIWIWITKEFLSFRTFFEYSLEKGKTNFSDKMTKPLSMPIWLLEDLQINQAISMEKSSSGLSKRNSIFLSILNNSFDKLMIQEMEKFSMNNFSKCSSVNSHSKLHEIYQLLSYIKHNK